MMSEELGCVIIELIHMHVVSSGNGAMACLFRTFTRLFPHSDLHNDHMLFHFAIRETIKV